MALGLTLILQPYFPQVSAKTEESGWYWFGECRSGKVMGVDLLMDGEPIYRSQFRACRLERSVANVRREQRTVVRFQFSGGHTFQGRYLTKKAEKIQGAIWQAGADPDAILLGVSFMTSDQVLLNTIHIVKPGKTTQSELDRGLVMKTYPVGLKAEPSANK